MESNLSIHLSLRCNTVVRDTLDSIVYARKNNLPFDLGGFWLDGGPHPRAYHCGPISQIVSWTSFESLSEPLQSRILFSKLGRFFFVYCPPTLFCDAHGIPLSDVSTTPLGDSFLLYCLIPLDSNTYVAVTSLPASCDARDYVAFDK